MNINEVLIALGKGKIIKCEPKDFSDEETTYYKIMDNDIYYFIKNKSIEWKSSVISIYELKKECKSFSISKTDPVEEYKKELQKNYGALGFDKKKFPVSYSYNEGEIGQDKAIKFMNAIYTMLELKSHPLAVPANDYGQYKYFICLYITILKINNYNQFSLQLSEISPAFNNEIDAQQAIKDIGEDRLIDMFKVLQGIYD